MVDSYTFQKRHVTTSCPRGVELDRDIRLDELAIMDVVQKKVGKWVKHG